MSLFLTYSIFFSSFAFLCYGTSCLTTKKMDVEFRRYGLYRFKVLTGLLQILGAIGLLIGMKSNSIFLLSSGGLTLLMLMGVAVRIHVRDSFRRCIPALFFFSLNLFIFLKIFNRVLE